MPGILEFKSVQEMNFDISGVGERTHAWLHDLVGMNIDYRLQRTGGMPDLAKFPVRLGGTALGPKIVFEGDPLGSSYRIQ